MFAKLHLCSANSSESETQNKNGSKGCRLNFIITKPADWASRRC